LNEQGQWQKAADSDSDQYLLRVAEIKSSLIPASRTKPVKPLSSSKGIFPVSQERISIHLCRRKFFLAAGKLTKAVRQYDAFLDKYPASSLKDAALNREFELATEFLAGRKKKILIFKVSRLR